jgi:hypothetical protein
LTNNSVENDDSFNTEIDNEDSFNTDTSVRVEDSYNADNSTTTMVVTSMELGALVTDVHIDAHGFKEGEITTGSISMDNGAFANFGGINTASMNTGMGSANQAATAVGANANVEFGNGRP